MLHSLAKFTHIHIPPSVIFLGTLGLLLVVVVLIAKRRR